jgi:hypothetical protein
MQFSVSAGRAATKFDRSRSAGSQNGERLGLQATGNASVEEVDGIKTALGQCGPSAQ